MSVHEAIQEGNVTKLRKLLARGGKENEPNAQGVPPLLASAREGKAVVGRLLLKHKADINGRDREGHSALQLAAQGGHHKFCELLLKKKFAMEAADAALILCQHNAQFAETGLVLKLLAMACDLRTQLSYKDREGNTALHYAAQCGAVELARFLLDHQANSSALNHERNTPLHLALQQQHQTTAALILAYPCSVTTVNRQGITALQLAQQHDFKTVAALIEAHAKAAERRMEVEDFPVSSQEALPIRYGHATVVHGKMVYLVGGCNAARFEEATHFYEDITSVHLETGQVTHAKAAGGHTRAVAGHSASLVGKTIFVSGGEGPKGVRSKDLWALDLDSLQWSQLQTIPYQIPLQLHQSVASSRIEVFFLAEHKDHFAFSFNYDIVAHEWRKIPHQQQAHPPSRTGYTATRIRHNVYLFGGRRRDGTLLHDLWVYNLHHHTWEELHLPGSLPSPRYNHSASVVDETLLLVGGQGGDGAPLDEPFFYGLDTKTQVWYAYRTTVTICPRLYAGCLFSYRSQQALFLCGGHPSSQMLKVSLPVDSSGALSGGSSTRGSEETDADPEPMMRTSTRVFHLGRRALNLNTVKRRPNSAGSSPALDGSQEEAGHPPTSPHSPDSTTAPSGSASLQSLPAPRLLEHAAVLGEHTSTFSDDTLHLVQLLQSLLDEPRALDGERRELVLALCEELKLFLEGRPAFLCDMGKLRRQYEKRQHANRFLPNKFPYQYWQNIAVAHEYQAALPADLASLDRAAQKRYRIFDELVQTETLYVRDLAVIIGLFMRPLQNEFQDLVTSYECATLFQNVESLLDLHQRLLAQLQALQGARGEDQDVGGVFLALLEELRSKYNTYGANQVAAQDAYTRMVGSSPDFESFCELCSKLPETKGMPVDSYFIKPIQRICRYSLLLKELSHSTPSSWATASKIEEAKAAIDEVVARVNDFKRRNDTLMELLEIQNRFLALDDPDVMRIPKLLFRLQGEMKGLLPDSRRPKALSLFLFQDLLLLAQHKRKGLHKLVSLAPGQWAASSAPDSRLGRTTFVLHDQLAHTVYELAPPTLEERDRWVSVLSPALSSMEGRVKSPRLPISVSPPS